MMTHLVLKNEDMKKYLSDEEKIQLESITQTIIAGRHADGKVYDNYYLVINEDEPYASEVAHVLVKNSHWAPRIVIAGNVQQYKRWCQVNSRDPRLFRYVSDPRDLAGRAKDTIAHLVGEYWLNPSYDESELLSRFSQIRDETY